MFYYLKFSPLAILFSSENLVSQTWPTENKKKSPNYNFSFFRNDISVITPESEFALAFKTVALYSWLLFNLWSNASGPLFFPRKYTQATYFSSHPYDFF